MSAPNLAESILQALDIAVLCRTGERQYTAYGQVPEFYTRMFPGEPGQPCTTPGKHSAMLDFFLGEAELFFARNQSGAFSSGLWQEDGVQTGREALMATALCFGADKVLIIRVLTDEFTDRSRILQKAREQLLVRRSLCNDVELYKQKARVDALTTLVNRATFQDSLLEEIERAATSGSDLSLLLLDIDDFKGINDVYGHLAGDSVLSTLGRLLRSFLRREDIAARYGGEEFAVIAPSTMQHQAVRMAEKLRNAIAEHGFGSLPPITVSVGCATYRRGETPEQFIQRADVALYDAKANGKNIVRMR